MNTKKGFIVVIDSTNDDDDNMGKLSEFFAFVGDMVGVSELFLCDSFREGYDILLKRKEIPSILAVNVRNIMDVTLAREFKDKYPETKIFFFPEFDFSFAEEDLATVVKIRKTK